MLNGSAWILVNRERPSVYSVAETYPKFVKSYDVRDITFQNEREIEVRAGTSLVGFPLIWVGHGTKTPPERIDFVQTRGLLEGLRASWSFEDIGATTRVTIAWRLHPSGSALVRPLRWAIARLKVQRTVRLILKALKEAAEFKT